MTSQYQVPFLDYYKKHKISPVAQDITDIRRHFERRNALYRQCGLPSTFIKGKSVLEVGPGTGHNSLFTNAMKPQKYVMVDGNPSSIQALNTLMNEYFEDLSNCEIIESDFESFSYIEKFDLVLAEGIIPTLKNPKGFLQMVAENTKPGGVVLITCMDHVSWLSEILRKVAGRLLLDGKELNEQEKLEKLRPFFAPHLASLSGMSRSVDDWIYDNILQPTLGELLSIEDAINSLFSEFDFHGSSPNFFVDPRWYKNIYGDQERINELAIESFRKNIHNLLDYRYTFDPIEESTGKKIASLCQAIFELVILIQNEGNHKNTIAELNTRIQELITLVSGFSENTADSLRDFSSGLEEYLKGRPFPSTLDKFGSWFGRGQQYVSFIRKGGW